MSKVDQKLDDLLDIQGEIVQAEKNLPTISSNDQDKGNDYKYSREIFYGLVERGQDAIEGILDIAKESEHPRVYEVAGQLIKTVGETTEKLIDLQDNVIKEIVNNADEITAKVINKLSTITQDKSSIKKAVKIASKNILTEN